MEPFVYRGAACRVVFGAGAAAGLSDEIAALGAARALVCCTPGRRADAEALAEAAAPRAIGVCARGEPFTPIEAAEDGRRMARETGVDCLVSYGGGNAVGLAKAIALELGLPIIAVPTTYSGSETTALQGIREGGTRTQHRSARMQPRTLIYDPALSLDLPLRVAVPSGINAIAQAVGSFMAKGRNPLTALLAAEGIRAMAAALPRIAADPADAEARSDALYGAFLCGSTIMAAGTILHHKVCHVLAGDFALAHAEVHTVVLPHSAAYNRPAAPEAMRRIAGALGAEGRDAPGALFDLLLATGAPRALKDIGMPEDGLDRATALILTQPYDNPRPYERGAIRALLDDAWHGRRPAAG